MSIATESELVAFLRRKIDDGLNDQDNEISATRKNNLNAYLGAPYGNERDGYSQVITREVMETVEWAKPLIMRPFASGDRVVAFVPVGPDDEAQADQETDIVRHVLFEENNGFLTLLNWITDALIYPTAYAKIWCDHRVENRHEEYKGLTEMELTQLLMTEDELELLSSNQYPGQMEMMYDVELRRISRDYQIHFEPCQPDQIIVDNDLNELSLESADFVCHRVQRTHSWLVENGYDSDELKMCGGEDESAEWGDERTSRLFYTDERPDNADSDDESMKLYWVNECYVSLDMDGDGVAERRRVVMIGEKIFENEESDYLPIIAMSAIPMAHKHTGMSLVDTVKDMQLVQTTLTRNLLDNIYRLNIRRKYVGRMAQVDDGTTLDQLNDVSVEIIECEDESRIREEQVQPIAPEILSVMQEIGQQVKTRTGVAPQMTLDAEALRDTKATAYMGALEQASQRIEMMTRVFAETGVKDALLKCHRLLREYVPKAKVIRMRGNWVSFDPSAWRERRDVTVEVGTGFYAKEKRQMMLTGLLQQQKDLMQFGVVQPQNLYHSATRLADAMGERSPQMFFVDPSTLPPPPPPPPDPNMAAIEAQMQIEGQKRQLEAQKMQMEAALKQKELEVKAAQQAQENMQQGQQSQVAAIEKARLEREANELKKQLALLQETSDEKDRQLKAEIARAEIESRERIEMLRQQSQVRPDPTPQVNQVNSKVDAVGKMVQESERKRERRMDVLAAYFSGNRSEEALRDAIQRMQAL